MPQAYRGGELVVVIDCSDLDRSAQFWSAVLGYEPGRVTTGPYRSLQPQPPLADPDGNDFCVLHPPGQTGTAPAV
jgi:catechol 2,3-dioxygenase-like lactoylglutathione lyase family enzyme